jgi:site-specific recombinase XerD
MTDFSAFLQSKDFTTLTQQTYLYNTERFIKWYASVNSAQVDPLNATTKDVLDYLDYLQNVLDHQNITRQHHLVALKQYFEFLELPAVTAFIKLQGTKKHRLSYLFKPQELVELYDDYYAVFIQNGNPDQNSLTHWRNYTMLGFLAFQGLTTSELDELIVEDVNLHKATLTITPKGHRRTKRTLPLQACQIGGLMQYLQLIRPEFLTNPELTTNQKLFLPLTSQRFRGNNKNLSITVSLRHLKKNLTTLHKDFSKMSQLRTSVITGWIKDKGLRKAQYLAGHKSIVSTEEYVHNDLEALTEDLTKYHPFS